MSRPTISSKAQFLAAFGECGSITTASKLAGVNRVTTHRWRKSDPEFAAAFDEAQQVAAARLEDEAVRRAVDGVRRYRFRSDGSPILHPVTGEPYFEEVYSDTLLVLLLKARNPSKFQFVETTINAGPTAVQVYLPENGRDGAM